MRLLKQRLIRVLKRAAAFYLPFKCTMRSSFSRFIGYSIVGLFIFSIISLNSCDRLKNKWERRERKLHYLQEELDSARKRESHIQDSLWRVLDSAKQKKQ